MQINWFEILAQLINFFILLFILQKLFYKPVTKAMEQRQENLRKTREEADAEMETAKRLIENYRGKMEKVSEKEEKVLKEAREKAAEEKQELLAKYREEAEEKKKVYMAAVEEEKEKFLKDLRVNLGRQAVAVAEKIMEETAEAVPGEGSYRLFLKKIDELSPEMIEEEKNAEKEGVTLFSSAEMSEGQKKELEEKLQEIFGKKTAVEYAVKEELIMGYELKMNTVTVHKNFRKQLEEVERKIREYLEKGM